MPPESLWLPHLLPGPSVSGSAMQCNVCWCCLCLFPLLCLCACTLFGFGGMKSLLSLFG